MHLLLHSLSLKEESTRVDIIPLPCGCGGARKCFSEVLSIRNIFLSKSSRFPTSYEAIFCLPCFQFSLGNSKIVCSLVEYLYPVLKTLSGEHLLVSTCFFKGN